MSARIRTACLMLAVLLCTALLCAALLCGCDASEMLNGIVRRPFYAKFPSGFTAKEEHFDPNGWMDYTDYCKYFYPDAEGFKADTRFKPVSEVGAESIAGYFENFRGWMEAGGRLSEYDFDPAMISGDDLVRIETDPRYTEYDDYTLWFFDCGTCVMYYIHADV